MRAPPFAGNDNWYRFLLHKLTSGCTSGELILNNDVTFVTFSYDVSLEIELYRGLGHLAKFSEYAEKFITDNDRILHVYGRVRKDPPWELTDVNWKAFGGVSRAAAMSQINPPKFWTDAKTILDHAFEASRGLQIIAPEKALAENAPVPDHIQKARTAIAEAECLYILGYGFDPLNSSLLKLSESLNMNRSTKSVMFTNYLNSGVINKNAARLFAM
jgi:hypothetical protein